MVRLLRRHGLVVNVFLPSVRLSISITCRPSTSDCNTYCAVCGVRFRGSNRNGPPAAVFHHGSTGREFALEHTSHCEKLATRPARDGIHHPASDTAGWDKPGFLDPVGSVCLAIDQAGPETAGGSRFGRRCWGQTIPDQLPSGAENVGGFAPGPSQTADAGAQEEPLRDKRFAEPGPGAKPKGMLAFGAGLRVRPTMTWAPGGSSFARPSRGRPRRRSCLSSFHPIQDALR